MKIILVFIACFAALDGYSQYFFNDIVSTQTSNDQYKLLRSGRIKKLTGTSYEPDNTVSEGFLLEEDISMDGKRITVNTGISGGKPGTTTYTYELSKLRRSRSYSNGIENRTEYIYNDKGRIQQISLITTDTAMKYTSTEVHEWTYTAAGEPASMLRIKDKTDSTQVVFVRDEKGLIAEEHWKKKGRDIETYYYYYDDAGRLTDIVRYNTRLRKLVPDFQYEYDVHNRIIRMTQISLGSASYFVWKYTYDERGLKLSETAYDKEKKIAGRIEYTYEKF
jgi:YD repeat-containing protein